MLLADDVVWNAPEPGCAFGAPSRGQELFPGMVTSGGAYRAALFAARYNDVLASDDRVVVLQTTRGERDRHGSLEDSEAIVLHVRDGRVVEVWEHPGDVNAMDALFS